jgi:hypothetical protein
MTMTGLRKKKQFDDSEGEVFAYLPSSSSRPVGFNKFNCE